MPLVANSLSGVSKEIVMPLTIAAGSSRLRRASNAESRSEITGRTCCFGRWARAQQGRAAGTQARDTPGYGLSSFELDVPAHERVLALDEVTAAQRGHVG